MDDFADENELKRELNEPNTSNGGLVQPVYETVPVQPQYVEISRVGEDARRLAKLLWVFAGLLFLFVLPFVIGKITHSIVYNSEMAKVEVADLTLTKLNNSDISQLFRTVAKAVGPSVVNIRTLRQVSSSSDDELDYMLGGPRERAMFGQGSGVIVDPDGYIVTNNHVIQDAKNIVVQLSYGDGKNRTEEEFSAEVIGADVPTDIAVLKINQKGLPARKWGDSDQLEDGSLVWAVGSPFGLVRSITFGIVSATNRKNVQPGSLQEFLQTDAAVNPGNSGGPLFNANGQIVGINTAIVGTSYQGISFAIPSNLAREIYLELRENGKISRGWLGVRLGVVTPENARALKLNAPNGVLVLSVFPNSPAGRAGLQTGDLILTWNGVDAIDPSTLSRVVAATEIGSKASVNLIRKGRKMELKVLVEERPDLPEEKK